MQYIWQQPNWTSWQYDINQLATPLANLRHQQGLLLGRMQLLGFALRDEAWLTTLTNDVLKNRTSLMFSSSLKHGQCI